VSAFQVVPPLADETISAALSSVLIPTATQNVDVGHDTPTGPRRCSGFCGSSM